ncbi:hypothetical protein GCM10009847_20790 [Leucobacter tardus]|uniref:Diguanylate cyclase n=1 Tax=Leucobacter tardus TaxID=501483 RepID=A0A939QE09_9MICO|nr:GGDEF domain-containing protein [Leucobacter tardus]MBO2990407.1 diguanylate cyclase [Leucobacter tardus]
MNGADRRASGAGLWSHHDAHSVFISVAAALLTVTLVVDLLTSSDAYGIGVLSVMLVVTATMGVVAIVQGARIPRSFGLAAVCAFGLAQVFFLSGLSDAKGAVSSLQELPILGFYLGWFVRPVLARTLMSVSIVALILAILTNPDFAPDGQLGVPTAVHGLLGAIFCFEVGSYLWRRSTALANTDPLTGVLNRRGFLASLRRELRVPASQRRHAMAFVVIDFDDFKLVNDTSGHGEGDRVLREIVGEWEEESRTRDLIGRTGGDEFVMLLRRTDERQAAAMMQRLQAHSAHPWSWGAVTVEPEDSVDSLFARADAQLYLQKSARKSVS